MAGTKPFSKISDVLVKFDDNKDKQSLSLEYSRDKYISVEFQKFGYDLAKELGDLKHKSLYIKLAKTESRGLLETARNFIKDANNVKNRPALFLWKFKELKNEVSKKK